MKAEVEQLEKNKVRLKVEVPVEKVDDAIGKAFKTVGETVSIPGFRKGKVPRTVIESRVGKEPVLQQAVKDMIPRYLVEAIKETKVDPVERPSIEVVQMEEGKPFLFNATFEVKPQAKLKRYKGIEVEKLEPTVSREEVDAQIELMRNRFAQLEVVEGRAAVRGDFVLINFEGTVNGRPFQGGSANDFLLELGSGTLVPTFEEQLMGARKGEIRNVIVDMPPDYQTPELAGKRTQYKVLVKEIKRKVLPEIDDQFAKQVSPFETMEEFRKDIERQIMRVKDEQAEAAVKTEILEKLSSEVEVEIPGPMIDARIDEMMHDLATNLQMQGVTLQQYLQAAKMTPEQVTQQMRPEAERTVRNQLILEAVARAEGLDVTDDEADNEIRKLAERAGQDFAEAKKRIQERGSDSVLRETLLLMKALDFLRKEAKVNVRSAPTESAVGEPEVAKRKPVTRPKAVVRPKTDAKSASGRAPAKKRARGGSRSGETKPQRKTGQSGKEEQQKEG